MKTKYSNIAIVAEMINTSKEALNELRKQILEENIAKGVPWQEAGRNTEILSLMATLRE